jgi:hypothetical protein
VRSFLLYLVGCALFTNKTNRHIDLIYLDCMTDLQAIGKWSQGGMTLAYLYDYLDDFVRSNNITMAGSTTLLMVII